MAVFNYDNDITRSLAKTAPAKAVLFSRKQRLEEGVYLRDNTIWLTNEMGSREVLPLSDIRLPGVHNIENYMAAIAAVDGLVPDKCVRAVAQRFTGVEHRIELVREVEGVKYYNDSIGTSPTRTMACLESFDQKLILIAADMTRESLYAAGGGDRPEGEGACPERHHGARHPGGGGGGRGLCRQRFDHRGRPRPGGRRGHRPWGRPARGHRGPLARLRRL